MPLVETRVMGRTRGFSVNMAGIILFRGGVGVMHSSCSWVQKELTWTGNKTCSMLLCDGDLVQTAVLMPGCRQSMNAVSVLYSFVMCRQFSGFAVNTFRHTFKHNNEVAFNTRIASLSTSDSFYKTIFVRLFTGTLFHCLDITDNSLRPVLLYGAFIVI